MNRLLFFVLLLYCVAASGATYTVDSIPNQRLINGSHIADPDAILDDDSRTSIDRQLIDLEEREGVQIAVVAIESIGDADLVSFAQDLFVHWKIGHKGRDDGLLILLVKDRHAVRLHTGYGLEGVLPDVTCSHIIQRQMLPAFREERYGDGVLAGVRAVSTRLRTASAADFPAPTQPETGKSLRDAAWMWLAVFSGCLFTIFGFKAMLGDFTLRVALREQHLHRSMYWSVSNWLLMYYLIPVIIGGLILLVADPTHWILLVGPIYLYYLTLTGWEAARQQHAVEQLIDREKANAVDRMLRHRNGFWLLRALLFPFPILFVYLHFLSERRRHRDAPRRCRRCLDRMEKLDPFGERDYLTPAQQTEETLKSVDYDVWHCGTCGAVARVVYDGEAYDRFARCPACRRRAYARESEREIIKATEDATGQGELVRACKHCGHRVTSTYVIPRLTPASSSSSSSSGSSDSSSSSSGSSWGGGDSGGGGASGSW